MSDKLDRFSKRARKVLTMAQEEAQRLNHNYIGTEHILLGLIREGEGVAAAVLQNSARALPPAHCVWKSDFRNSWPRPASPPTGST